MVSMASNQIDLSTTTRTLSSAIDCGCENLCAAQTLGFQDRLVGIVTPDGLQRCSGAFRSQVPQVPHFLTIKIQ